MPISESIQLGVMGAGSILVALLACQTKVDDEGLKKKITEMFDEQLELKVDEIDCPKDIKAEKGKEFECTVKVKPKGKVIVLVEVTANDGSLSMKTKDSLIIVEKLAKEVKEKGLKDLECPEAIHPVKKDEVIKCTAKDETGAAKTVLITGKDDKTYEWKVE